MYAFYRDGTTIKFKKGTRSANSTSFSWGSATSTGISDSTAGPDPAGVRMPIKAVCDPLATDAVYLLLGTNTGGGDAREIWRTSNGGSTWTRLAPTGSTHLHPTDFAFSSQGGKRLLVTFDREAYREVSCSPGPMCQAEGNYLASVWKCDTSTPTWTLLDSVNDVRGAVSYKDPYWYVSNVRTDACPTIPASAGIWRAHRANDSTAANGQGLKRFNEGANWQGFWGPCPDARGQTISNLANSVSADGQYWVGAMNVWKVNSSGELLRESTQDNGGGGWSSVGIDNANNAMLYVNGTDLYAGFYDIGLFKTSASSPGVYYDQNSTDADWGGDDNFGGNVNGMVVVGSTRYVIDAPSSKGNINDPTKEGYEYRIWKSVSGGSWTKLSNQPGWINNVDADHHRNHAYMRGICYDGSHLYVSSNGVVYRDSVGSVDYPWQACVSNLTSPSDPLASPSAPIYSLGASNGTVLAGGPTGIYRSVNNGGTWTRTCTLGSVAVNCVGDTLGRGGNTKGNLHTEAWTGIHQFLRLTGDDWLATAYIDYDSTYGGGNCVAADTVGWGLLFSHDDGQSWTRIAVAAGSSTTDRLLRGVAFSDTCDDMHRVIITSGAAFSSGTSTQKALDAAHGADLIYLQYQSGAPKVLSKQNVGAGFANYPPASVGACAVSNGGGDFLVTAPGYGVLRGVVNHPDECETTRPFSAGRNREEANPIRTVFSVQEATVLVRAGVLELYDLNGRRARELRHGLFFSVERDKLGAVTARRMVLVTR